ncbi:MAG: hypothetical protein ACLFR1_06105 [Spirochaetia bacterium]
MEITSPSSWFYEAGPCQDVVLASRARYARDLVNYRFPVTMNKDDEQEVESLIQDAFESIPNTPYQLLALNDLSPLDRRILMERNIITQEFSVNPQKKVCMREDSRVFGTLNSQDHLRTACIYSGLALRNAFDEIENLDKQLEDHLDFAVSLDFGYLNSEITNIGTGLRASVMFHLPALVQTNLIEKALKVVSQHGVSVKGFLSSDEHSLGNMYQISNTASIGVSAEEILEKLEGIAEQLVNYERRAREEMLLKEKTRIEDKVFRAYGILKYCRKISSSEAIDCISSVHLGKALGLIEEVDYQTLRPLLFLTQKAHVQKTIEDAEKEDEDKIDAARAEMIRKSLNKGL